MPDRSEEIASYESADAIKSVPPVVHKALLSGISAPSMIRIGHSMTS
jgi:hypothetical protein